MTARRRSRKRAPLRGFAQRSPLQAVAAALIRLALLAGLAVVLYLVIMNVLVPGMVENLIEEFRSRRQ